MLKPVYLQECLEILNMDKRKFYKTLNLLEKHNLTNALKRTNLKGLYGIDLATVKDDINKALLKEYLPEDIITLNECKLIDE